MSTVVFFPAGDRTRASSRYRVYNVVDARPNFYLATKRNWKEADALVFQRALSKQHSKWAEKARGMGKLVGFDCSDFFFHGSKWGSMNLVKRLARHAHFMTTSNEDDKHSIERKLKRRCYVIPGAQPPSPHRRKHAKVSTPSIVWVGRVGNMHNLEVAWPALRRLANEGIPFQVVLINDNGSTGGHTLRLPRGHRVVGKKWGLGGVHKMVAQCDVGINPKVKQADGRYHKDQNISILIWSCGIPCVTFGITDWYGGIKRFLLDWEFRKRQGGKGIARARLYEPGRIAERWKEVIEQEMKRKK